MKHKNNASKLRGVRANLETKRAETEYAVNVENLTVKYVTMASTVEAVNNVSFQLKKKRSLGIVGETGGKDYVLADETADPRQVATALARGSFEYQGQKCSAASRAYIPLKLWDEVKQLVRLGELHQGGVHLRVAQIPGKFHEE